MLRLVLPKGSLEKATLELFSAADLPVVRSSAVDYKATIDDPRIADVRILRPQEIPMYVAEGLFDFGITGRDWVEETGSEVIGLGELRYSRPRPILSRCCAVAADSRGNESRTCHRVCASLAVPQADERYFTSKGTLRMCGCRMARRGPISPTSPTASSRSRDRRALLAAGCGSSTRSDQTTPRWSPTRRRRHPKLHA